MAYDKWIKNNPDDVIWWLDDPENIGTFAFSFDKETVFYMFSDYPYKLTPEQIEIFDRENPQWSSFFKDRKDGN